MTESEKKCTDCEQWMVVEGNFYKNRANRDGWDTLCKPCRNVRNNNYHAKHPNYQSEYWHKVRKPMMMSHGGIKEYYRKRDAGEL